MTEEFIEKNDESSKDNSLEGTVENVEIKKETSKKPVYVFEDDEKENECDNTEKKSTNYVRNPFVYALSIVAVGTAILFGYQGCQNEKLQNENEYLIKNASRSIEEKNNRIVDLQKLNDEYKNSKEKIIYVDSSKTNSKIKITLSDELSKINYDSLLSIGKYTPKNK